MIRQLTKNEQEASSNAHSLTDNTMLQLTGYFAVAMSQMGAVTSWIVLVIMRLPGNQWRQAPISWAYWSTILSGHIQMRGILSVFSTNFAAL